MANLPHFSGAESGGADLQRSGRRAPVAFWNGVSPPIKVSTRVEFGLKSATAGSESGGAGHSGDDRQNYFAAFFSGTVHK